MNKIYKVIWNSQLRCWQAVSELAKNHSTSQSTVDHKNALTGTVQKVSGINLIRLAFWGLALLPLSIYAAISNTELPTGANITQGSANISQNGNVLNIHQNSQNLSTNWNTFNIGKDATVNFNQQNQSSIAINRVLDSNASQIMGRLNANGQVFLLNPNGVVFSKTAQVNVGGLVASTLSLNDADIQNGKYTLKANANSTATIENNGTIQTLSGGTVALIAPNVKNTGSIVTPNGVTHLTAASQVTLALQDGSLTQYQVDQGVLKGLVDNGGAILADNGAVYLTAKAKDSLSKAVVNHSGIIEANRLSQNAKGEIILLGDMQNGETNVSGLLKAEGKNGQDGGFIETSAAQVKIENSTVVSSHSEGGKIGNWLIDPTDFSINSGNASASSSGIGATTLASILATSNVILLTSTTGNQKGDINVNADVTWGSANSLTLNAQNDININANITATNNSGKLNLIYGQNTANTSANYYINNGAKINLKAGQNFSTQKGTAATINYQVITALGAQGSTTSQDLQGINGNLSGNYVLGADIDASSTWQWNGYTGFDPIGFYNANLSPTDLSQQAFRGRFDGLGHAISGLSIESMYQGIGLFAITHQDTLIQNVGLNNISYSGYGKTGGIVGINLGTINNVYVNAGLVTGNTEQYGGLVGWNYNSGNILNSYANVTVKGKYSNNNYIGGLVGYSDGVVSSSFATGAVTGNNYIGGLVGGISGQINNSYATGTVIGSQYVGGLVGFNGGSVDKNYSSGSVTGGQYVGGLVGGGNGTTTNSFWNTSTSGRTSSGGGVGKTTTELQQISTFAGWDIDDAGGTGKVWRIYEGRSAPLLRHFLKPLVTEIVANFSDKIYDGSIASGTLASGLNYKTTSKNAGIYSLNDGSILISGVPIAANTTQFGDDVIYKENGGSGSLTIAKRDLNINGLSVADKVYDTSKVATLSGTAGVTVLSGDSVTLSGIGFGSFTDKNVGNNKNVIVSGYTLTGTDALNYTLLQPTNLKANITPAVLTINGISVADKTYDGLSNATINGSASINPFAGDFVGLTGSGIGTFTDKNAGIRSVIVTGYNLTGADAGNYIFSQPIGLSATIHKAQAIVKANSLNTVYNGKDQTAAGFSAIGLVNGETESVLSGVSATVTGKDAGKYTNTVTGADKNYELSFVDGSLDIAKAKATVTANSVSTTYNGKDQTAVGFSATGLVNGETTTVLSGVSATVTGKDAGSYANTATGIDKNYELSFVNGSLDIAKAKATVTANSVSTTYNGKDQTVAGFSATGLVNGETESVLLGVTATVTAKDAGKYTNTATGIDKNYELSFVDGSLDIAKAKATVTANSVSTTYNGKDQTAAGFSATGLVNGETESVLSGVSATVIAKDAGQYTNTATGLDKNYELSFVDGSLDIAKAKATVTANSLNTVYNGKDQTAVGFSATGLVNGETESVLSGVSATVTGKDAGSYANKASGADKNYELSFVEGSLDIAKAKAIVTANSVTTTYNGKDQTAVGFSATGLVNGETESVLSGVSATVTGKDAGSYANTATGIDKNYELSFVNGSLDIAKAKATVTANSVTTTYNGKDQTAAGFSAIGLVNGETTSVLSGVSATVTGKDAGQYTNTATGLDKNYELSFVDGSLDIAKAKATVTANSVSTTYNGKDQTAAGFNAKGLVNGETESVLSGVSSTVTAKDAGKYTNTVTGIDKNYDLTLIDGSLDIAKAKATVTANSVSTTYNGKDQTAAGFTATGLVNGETESVLSGVTATVTAKDAGKYNNTVIGVDKNYDLTLIDGSLDIAKAKATVTANSLNTVYNGKDQTAAGFSAIGLVNGETESVLSGVSATVTAKDAGKYINTATGLDKNYELSFVDGSLDIAKAKATVTANSISTTYNGKDQTAAGFSTTGLVNGETESVLSGVTATVTAKDAGKYTNSATGLDKNYDLSFVDGSLDIAKAKATVTANSVSTTYNGKDQTAAGFSATGLVNGETESVLSGVTATVTAKDAGQYTNTATGLDKNYELSFVDGSLDIAKAKATVTANSLNTVYNGKDQTAAGFTATGLVNGETESVLSGVTATVTAKDAGKYTNTATGLDKNYDLSFIDGSFDIAKAKATVTANSISTTYNGKDQTAAGFSAIGLVNGETTSVLSGVSATVTGKDAGQYTNTATGLDKNYELSFVDGSLDIAKAKATVTANSVSTTYNGKDQTAAGFTATGLVNGETESVLSGVNATVTAKDAGQYTNTATGLDKNYDLSFVDGALDIAKAKATVTANSVSTIYNGKDQTAAGFTATGLVNGETESVLSGVSATVTAKDAGQYTNTATGLDKNYELSFVDGSLDIAKAKATVTANSVSTTYNGKDQTAAGFTATGLVNGETESVLSGVNATVTAKDAGQYTNSATGLDKNYELSFVDGSLDIAKAKATVTANSLNTVYNGKDQTAAGFSAIGLVNGETESVLSGVSATVTAKDAGQYTNTATGLDKNYELSFVDGSLDIAKAKATVTANSVSTIYNGKDQTAAGFTATGLVNGETESVLSDVTATVTAKDAGKYNNIVTGVDKNYDLTLIDGSLDIAKAKATVTANSISTTYNGKDQTAAGFSATGLVNGETTTVLSDVSATVTGKDAGSYANTATGIDKNYELSFVNGSLDIAKAKATVTANSVSTTYNGKDQTAVGFTATGLVNGEDTSVLSGVSATVTAKDAGQYTNSATGLDKNYELSFVDGSLDIAKAKATVTANSVSTTYNGKDQTAAGFTAVGLVNGETESVLSGVTATVTAKDAGKYNNKVTGVDKNYDLTLIDGSLDIAKAKAIVTANSVSTTYNGKDQTAAGFSATGLVNGETESVLSGVSATVTAKDAGQYTNTATGLDKNYELSFVDGSLDIAKAKAIVTANSVSTTYNGKDQTAAGFTATGLVNGETTSVLSGVSATVTAKDAGQYTNTATGLDKNYELSFVDGSLDIAKAKATVTANSVSTTYNGKDQTAAGFTATGLVNGETESVLSSVSATVTAKDAGQYTNTATGLDKNYELSFVDGSLDIAKAKATVTANSVSTTYNGKDQTAAGFTATGLVNSETESVLSGVSATVTAKDAGQYTNTATGIDKNYELSFVDGSLDIAKAKATVTANSISTTYNGKDQTAAGFTATGLVNGETDSVLSGVSATVTAKDAGKYTNTATGLDKNYELSFVDGSLDIAKAKATVTANSVSTTYNGKDQTAAGFSATGLVNGETTSVLSGVSATVTGKDAGKYTNTVTGVDKNYDLTLIDGSLDIAKAKATVTANSVSTTYNGKNQTAAGFSATGLVSGENESVLSGVSATVTGKDAGKYTNTATGLDKNYELSFVDGSLDIAKAKATVTANSVSTTYNGKGQTAAGFSATGLVNGETESVLSGVSATVTAKYAGKYVNTATGLDKNYDLSFVDGALDIAKAKATVTANSVSTIYNGKDQTAAGFTATGLVNGETESVLSGVSATVTAKDAGKYTNSATGLDKNYELSFVDGSLDIAKAKINQVTGISANNRIYDATTNATLNTGSAQFTGMVAGDELKVASATGQFSDKNVGIAKQVSIQGVSLSGADAHNYELVNNTAQTTADIRQANIQNIAGITANNRTYNGLTAAELNLSNAQFNGIYAGDNLNVATATGQFDSATTGQAKNVSITGLSLGGLDAQNYKLVDTTAVTTADIYLLTPAAYLQAIQFKRPRYLPETNNVLNTVDLDVRQGGVNTAGIQILAGEH